jgi:hypothetical protein
MPRGVNGGIIIAMPKKHRQTPRYSLTRDLTRLPNVSEEKISSFSEHEHTGKIT